MNPTKSFRLALAAAFLTAATLATSGAQAQTAAPAATTAGPLKIAYTSVQYVLSQMPESKQIESELKTYSGQLEAQLKTKTTKFQSDVADYQKASAGAMSDVVKADREKDLSSQQQSIQEFQRNAEQSLQQKQQTLLKPALEKLQKNIDVVANENGYTYVLNSDGDSPLLLHGPKDGDISDLILKKMGITPTARNAAPAAAASAPRPAAPAPSKSKTKSK